MTPAFAVSVPQGTPCGNAAGQTLPTRRGVPQHPPGRDSHAAPLIRDKPSGGNRSPRGSHPCRKRAHEASGSEVRLAETESRRLAQDRD